MNATAPTPQNIQRKIIETAQEDHAGKAALSEPLPGPLRAAWAPCKEIPVGPFSVRPFCDYHFEILSLLGNRFIQEVEKVTLGQQPSFSQIPRGPELWQLAFVMTRPSREVRELAKRGLDAVSDAAADAFGDCSLMQLGELFAAIVETQLPAYWATALVMEAKPEPVAEGENSGPPTAAQ